jgi:hypothetical protein
MKKIGIIGLIPALLLISGVCLAEAPHQVGGFVLGANVEDFKDKLRMHTAIPIRYMESIHEAEIKPMEGFKTGLIGFGTCTTPNPIVRIKLKYADSSKKFYEKLLKRFKKRFGEPTEWRGDPFHIVLAWKWSFTDKDNNRISLNLSHNTMDMEEKRGNSVKLTMLNLVESQCLCFQKKHPDFRNKRKKQQHKGKSGKSIDWELFVPK